MEPVWMLVHWSRKRRNGMPHNKTAILAVSLMALALAGCQSDRFSSMNSPAPQPLPSAPSAILPELRFCYAAFRFSVCATN
ncbi:hypothetical protein LC061_21270, partial [Nitratireductor aquimarinus]|nr:hypothetical protein [Nitratireductor aquimarinus]